MNRPTLLAFLSLASALLCSLLISCSAPNKDVLAITHVTVIDVAAGSLRSDQTVIIEKQRIKTVGPTNSVAIPPGSRIVDATGKFLIPGLVDMHIHLTAAGEPDGSRRFMLPMLLANGVTTVRDMGGYLESLFPLRKEIEQGKRPGPQIFTPGPYLDGSPPSFQPSLVVTNRVQAEEAVHELQQRGVDFIKVQSILNRDAYFAIAGAAKREHIAFAGHVPDRVTAAEAADAGQHSIEHLTNVLRGCSRDEEKLMREQFYVPAHQESPRRAHARIVAWQRELLNSYSQQVADSLIAKFKEKDVWQTPTLVLLKKDAFPTVQSAERNDPREMYVPKGTLRTWSKSHQQQMRLVDQPESDLRSQLFLKSQSIVAKMQASGVRVLAGTDSPAPGVIPGFALHEELALLVQSGFTPPQALQAATTSAAEFLGTSKDSGSIAPGKYADLVLLDADPLDDIHNTQKIRAVILRGKLLDRVALDALLESARSFAGAN